MKIICKNPLSLQQLLLIQILFTMKIYKSCLLAVALLATTPVCLFAQDDTLPEYDAARAWTPDKNEQKTFSLSIHPNYFKGSTRFWYSFKTSQGENVYVVDPATRTKRVLFSPEDIASEISEQSEQKYTAQQLPIKDLKLKDDNVTFEFTVDSVKYEYQYVQQKLTNLGKEKKERPAQRFGNVSPDKQWVVYAKNYNLYMMSHADYERIQKNPKDSTITEIQLSKDGIKDFGFTMERKTVSDGSDPKVDTSRRQMANGYWSPDSKYFVSIISDQRKIKNLWVINVMSEPRPTLETYKYQMPGEEGATPHMYVFDIANRSQKEVSLGDWTEPVVRLLTGKQGSAYSFDPNEVRTWENHPEWCYVMRMSRDFKKVDICTYTFGQDAIVPVLEERMPQSYLDTRNLISLDKGNRFIWWSERDGWGHLYLYDKSGKLINRITKGAWHVEDIKGVDEAKKVIYFSANGREPGDSTPYYEHLYKVNFDGSGLQLLTPGNYFHTSFMDDQHAYIVDNYSRVDTKPAIDLLDNSGRKLMTLEEADFSQLFAAGYKFPELFKVKAADGVTDLYGVMYKPFNFDSTMVYPVVDYVYPGPQTEGPYWRYNRVSPRTDRLAQAGFIVISVGQRGGHPSRSKWYHDFGYQNLRDYPLADHKAAIEQLCAQNKFMDITKVGITGHSGGGFMSTAAILTYPDFFKVAVSCSGNHDNNVYNRSWSEKYHGVTERIDENGKVHFDIHIPANQELASRLKGHLLLMTGDIDDNVHPAGTIRMVNALIKAGKRFDMLILPEKRHQYEGYNEYFYWKMVDYFSEHLKGKSEKSIDIKDLKLGNWWRGAQEDI